MSDLPFLPNARVRPPSGLGLEAGRDQPSHDRMISVEELSWCDISVIKFSDSETHGQEIMIICETSRSNESVFSQHKVDLVGETLGGAAWTGATPGGGGLDGFLDHLFIRLFSHVSTPNLEKQTSDASSDSLSELLELLPS